MNALEANSILKNFGGVCALDSASLCCPTGEIVGLLGANGSGKSTMSKIIAGVIPCDEGEVIFQGERIDFDNPLQASKAGIELVHQHLSLIPDLTIWENIVMGHEPLTDKGFLDNKKAQNIAKEALDKLCPGINFERKVSSLSPAEMQLVEISKALAKEPIFLILDEPTAALERNGVERLFRVMRDFKESGVSMIFISHRLWEVKEICDRITVFRNGMNVGEIDLSKKEGKDKRIVELITGESATDFDDKERENKYDEIEFEVNNLTFGDFVNNVSFKVGKGEILGIGGLQGQGQEELLMLLSGYYEADSGFININNNKFTPKHPSESIEKGIVLIPGDRQKQGLFLNHSIFDNIIFPKAGLKNSKFLIPFDEYRKEAENIVNDLSIKTPDIDTKVDYLSGGNQQKVVFGKWLSYQPDVLLLSDPAKGVDVKAKYELYDVVKDRASHGTAVIVYASDSDELISFCDRVLIMYEGEIVKELKEDNINEENIVAASLRAEGE